eukprot:gene15122-16877_t
MSITYDKIKTSHDGVECYYLRVTEASVTITSSSTGKGSDVTGCASQWSRMLNYLDNSHCIADGGHILGNNLGGKGYVANIFPQLPAVNRGVFSSFEKQIANCLKPSPSINAALSWVFTYENDHHFRPDTVTYKTAYTGPSSCEDLEEVFPNIDDPLPAGALSVSFVNDGGFCRFQQSLLTDSDCKNQLPKEGVNQYSLGGDLGSITLQYEKVSIGGLCNVLRVLNGNVAISPQHLNDDGRIRNACFTKWSNNMNLANIQRGYTNNWRDYDSCPSDAGHILAHSLSGPEAMWNVFPQDPTLNTGQYGAVEDQIRNCLRAYSEEGIKALLQWQFIYDNRKYTIKPKQVMYTVKFTFSSGYPREPECSPDEPFVYTFNNYYSRGSLNSILN